MRARAHARRAPHPMGPQLRPRVFGHHTEANRVTRLNLRVRRISNEASRRRNRPGYRLAVGQ
ncbi:hypothetical protein SMG44B_30353 [Stenotrophomonas maltophilia]|nr:hypothetical protein BN1263100121 [Stenotrophomonas maltophilia]